ncbi:MAG: histidine phosphatase family protein, partial [Pseudomonadota bacterium]
MRRLLIMRHAKSDWGGHGLADHDRPLNRRGRLAAALMGAFLREDGLRPDLALVSSALRTRETWELMGLDAPTETLAVLYHAAPDAIFAAARRAPDDARTVLILGHQPGLQAAANALIGDRSI